MGYYKVYTFEALEEFLRNEPIKFYLKLLEGLFALSWHCHLNKNNNNNINNNNNNKNINNSNVSKIITIIIITIIIIMTIIIT